jgi:hypothetical protein
MTFNPFSALTSKVFGGALIAALAWCAFTTIDRNQWRASARKANAVLVQIPAAQAAALAAAKRAIADKEQQYRDQAHAADTTHDTHLADTGTAADRYIDTHRVPVCPASGATGATASSPQGSGSGLPASVPSAPVVAVSDADVRACTAAATYALDARAWALGL